MLTWPPGAGESLDAVLGEAAAALRNSDDQGMAPPDT
jgi:hypothetical protein